MTGARYGFSEAMHIQLGAQRFSRSPEARTIAAGAFADTIGCMFAGSTQSVEAAACRSLGIPQVAGRLVWPSFGVLPESAALVNATAAHVLEFDDHEILGITHPSAVLVPALLALAEGSERSGGDLLDAYVAGFETINCLGAALNPFHYATGWHSTSTIAALGTSVACSMLIGNGPEQTVHAFGICCSVAGGTRAQFGSMTKPLHAGFAAHAAVRSALMAKAGITASPDAFDGRFGIAGLMTGGAEGAEPYQPDYTFPSIEEHGPIVKLYPSCAATHRTVDAIRDLMRSHGLGPEHVAEIATEIPAVAASALVTDYPVDEYEARFSMSYCAATTIESGGLTLGDFTAEAVSRPATRRRADKVRLTSYATQGNPFASGNYRVVTTILTKSGDRLLDQRLHARGSKEKPLSPEERFEKFADCLATIGGEAVAATFFDTIAHMAVLKDTGALTKLLRNPAHDTIEGNRKPG
ncbi:MmgE/PrpD family protein [Chelativorans xinjiangense]|uniref:MmgE/PrpD family protein n=1 Tax=Chelativorans xinjiangense TaxID=2681485 RepID=UPI00135AD98E|nr:MmgE/PrpD family protein [Chelativorans xinjiangense]